MSNVFMPTLRRRLSADPSTAYDPPSDESVMNAPPAGMGAGPYSPPATPTAAAPAPSAPNPMNAYAARLGEVGQQLQTAYSAPHAGTLRQVLGAFVGNRNPALGGIISGETQRQRTIEPLQQEYGLIANVIAANRAAQTADIQNQERIRQGNYYQARADTAENPVPKTPEEQYVANLQKQINPATKKNFTPSEALADMWQKKQDVKPAPAQKPSEEDKALTDYMAAHGQQDTPANRDKARSILKTRDRKPVDDELTDINKKLKQAQLEKAMEATPDEQRRADLSTNLEENLGKLEDIARRRPELFGPLAGRVTGVRQWVGTDDPDVASLKNIEEQTGLAMVGAHAMRNAQHAEKAAQSITGANKNTAAALLAPNGPIATARQSIQTFKEDAQRRRNAIEGPAQSSGGKYARPKPNVVVEQ